MNKKVSVIIPVYNVEKYLDECLNSAANQTFENIEQIGVEATEKERYDSNLTTVWFLHELKIHGKTGDVWRIEDELLQKSIQILIQELDNIYFVFDIKENEQHVFPIHNMIAKVVERPEFVDINNLIISSYD